MRYSVYLGSKCNMSCAYCHREVLKEETGVSDKLITLLQDSCNKYDKLRIRFVGGEPTLYFEDIKKVVNAVPKAKFIITTNGYNTPSHIIDYMFNHKFTINISFDGVSNYRHKLPDFNRYKGYPYLNIVPTFCHGNTDISVLENEISKIEKIVGKSISYMPHPMHETNVDNGEYKLTREDVLSVANQIIERTQKFIDTILEYGICDYKLGRYYIWMKSRYDAKYEFGENYCVNRNHARVDYDGIQYTCSYIKDIPLDKDTAIKQQGELIKSLFPQCVNCEVYDMCGSACTKSRQHDIECLYYKTLFTWFKSIYSKHKEVLDRYALSK